MVPSTAALTARSTLPSSQLQLLQKAWMPTEEPKQELSPATRSPTAQGEQTPAYPLTKQDLLLKACPQLSKSNPKFLTFLAQEITGSHQHLH